MGGFFSQQEIEAMSGGIMPPAPRDYKLPTQFPSFTGAKRISIDFESDDKSIAQKLGPGWRRGAYPVGIAVAIQDRDGSIPFAEYYPVAHKTGPNLDGDKVWDWLSTELAFFGGEIVGTNLLYDGDGLQYQGKAGGVIAPMAKWRDVQWAEALIDENAPNYKLGVLSKKYLGVGKVTDELKALYGPGYIERFKEVHPGHARAYGLGDVKLPLGILDKQFEVMEKENLLELFDIECRLVPFLLYMRKLGVRVDLDKANKLGFTLAAKRDAALKECSRLCGIEMNADNFGKPSVLAMAFARLKIPVPQTAAGRISVTDQWLERLDHPFGEQLAIANKCDKAKGTFVDGYITDCAVGDRVHCEFHPLRRVQDKDGGFSTGVNGTVSGRFSGTNPNLQNIPARDEEIGPLCRSMFIADEGALWWSQDYSQIEYRFLVHYAVEMHCKAAELAQKEFVENPDADFHELCAKLIWHQEWAEVGRKMLAGEIDKATAKKLYKALRGPAKNLNFGMVYGMGEQLLAESLGELGPDGKANAKAKKIMADYHIGAPFIKDLNSKCVEFANKHKFITTILGRRRRFHLYEQRYTPKGQKREAPLPEAEARAKWGDKIKVSMTHKALNSRLQGSAADLMKVAMVKAWEAGIFAPGNDITCVLTVHDELNGSFFPTERGHAALRELKHVMETAMTLNVPILTSGSTGANWAEAK